MYRSFVFYRQKTPYCPFTCTYPPVARLPECISLLSSSQMYPLLATYPHLYPLSLNQYASPSVSLSAGIPLLSTYLYVSLSCPLTCIYPPLVHLPVCILLSTYLYVPPSCPLTCMYPPLVYLPVCILLLSALPVRIPLLSIYLYVSSSCPPTCMNESPSFPLACMYPLLCESPSFPLTRMYPILSMYLYLFFSCLNTCLYFLLSAHLYASPSSLLLCLYPLPPPPPPPLLFTCLPATPTYLHYRPQLCTPLPPPPSYPLTCMNPPLV